MKDWNFIDYWSVGFYNKIDANTNNNDHKTRMQYCFLAINLSDMYPAWLFSNMSIQDTQRDFHESIHFVCEIEALDRTDLKLGYLRGYPSSSI